MVVYQLPKLIARVRFPSPAPVFIYAWVFLALFISGCATTEHKPPVVSAPQPTIAPASAPAPKGIYHKVIKGQTVWRIAKTYNVTIDDIIRANNIPNAAAIEVNQLILIPGAEQVLEIPEVPTPDDKKEDFVWPVKGKVVGYYRDASQGVASRGIDIETSNPSEPVKAARDGVVVFADYLAGYQQTIMIDHGDGFVSVYAQNAKLLGNLGDHVLKGSAIAEASTVNGRGLMHFELRRGKDATNPLYYLP